MIPMSRVNRILQHHLYEDYSIKNKLAEEKRIYCRHGSDHGLSVARIAYIYLLENQESPSVKNSALKTDSGIAKEIVYAAGILHDIGRWVEYETKEDHAQAGSRLAEPILRESGYNDQEIAVIRQGILEHRLDPAAARSELGQALARADDWARDCHNCESKATCYKYTKAMEEIII
jgi:uncharacterized protein